MQLRQEEDEKRQKERVEQAHLLQTLGKDLLDAKRELELRLHPEIQQAEANKKLRTVMSYGIRRGDALTASVCLLCWTRCPPLL